MSLELSQSDEGGRGKLQADLKVNSVQITFFLVYYKQNSCVQYANGSAITSLLPS